VRSYLTIGSAGLQHYIVKIMVVLTEKRVFLAYLAVIIDIVLVQFNVILILF
jgi:hypothetical protein